MADVTQNDFRADFVGTVWVQFFCTNAQKPLVSIVMIKPAKQCRGRSLKLLFFLAYIVITSYILANH